MPGDPSHSHWNISIKTPYHAHFKCMVLFLSLVNLTSSSYIFFKSKEKQNKTPPRHDMSLLWSWKILPFMQWLKLMLWTEKKRSSLARYEVSIRFPHASLQLQVPPDLSLTEWVVLIWQYTIPCFADCKGHVVSLLDRPSQFLGLDLWDILMPFWSMAKKSKQRLFHQTGMYLSLSPLTYNMIYSN